MPPVALLHDDRELALHDAVRRPLGEERASRRGAQWADPEHLGLGIRRELGERAWRSRSLRQHHQRGQRVEAAGEHAEKAQRGVVRPLGIVDGEQQRLLGREVRAQPVQTVQRPEARIDLRALPRQLWQQHVRGEPGRAVEHPRPVVARSAAQRGLEQLADDPERPVALELGTARASHLESAPLGLARRRPQQARLAEPGSALQHHQGALACASGVEPHAESIQLAAALEE